MPENGFVVKEWTSSMESLQIQDTRYSTQSKLTASHSSSSPTPKSIISFQSSKGFSNRFSNRSNIVSSRENLIDRKFQAVTFPDSTAVELEGAPDDKSVGSSRVKSLM